MRIIMLVGAMPGKHFRQAGGVLTSTEAHLCRPRGRLAFCPPCRLCRSPADAPTQAPHFSQRDGPEEFGLTPAGFCPIIFRPCAAALFDHEEFGEDRLHATVDG